MKHDWAIIVGGIAFAGLTFAGIVLLLPAVAGGSTTNAEAATWMSSSAHRVRAIVGAYLMCGGAMAMVLFTVGLCQRLRAAGAGVVFTETARLAGVAFVGCQLLAAVAMAGTAYAVISGNEPTPIEPSAARITTAGLFIWLVPGMISASLFAASVGVASLSSKAFPTWVGLSALLVAGVLLAAITFLPVVLLLLWSAAVAIVSIVRRDQPTVLQAALAPP